MDYSKSGNAKFGKGLPRHMEKNAKIPPANGGRETKEQLLARMKASALATSDKKPA